MWIFCIYKNNIERLPYKCYYFNTYIMKKSTVWFNIILLPIDIIMIIAGFALAYYIRSQSEVIYIWSFSEYIRFVLYFLPIWIIIFTIEGLYNLQNPKRGINEMYAIVTSVSTAIAVMVMWLFLSRMTFFSRLVIVYSWLLSILLVYMGRSIIRLIQIICFKNNIGTQKLLIIGNKKICYDLIASIKNDPSLGYKLCGIVTVDNQQIQSENIKILGNVNDLETIYKKYKFDTIITTDPALSTEKMNKILDFCDYHKISLKEVPDLLQVKASNAIYSTIGSIPIINFRRTPLEGWGSIAKRIFDIFFSSILIILFSPIMLIIAVAIKLDSKGPIIYKNERVGNNGKTFYIYKFRYMRIEYCTGNQYGSQKALAYEQELIKKQSLKHGPLYKIAQDPRKTRVGTFIEKYKLDELPQFFNVLFGSLSLVGPRPHQPREVEKYEQRHFKLFQIKPGVTGLAQTSGSSDLTFEDEFKLDLYYIENWSLWLDFKTLFKTPAEMLRKHKHI